MNWLVAILSFGARKSFSLSKSFSIGSNGFVSGDVRDSIHDKGNHHWLQTNSYSSK